MICFILAGGFAKRMWPMTKNYPKCLLPVGEKPLLIKILDKIPDIEIYISTNNKFKNIMEKELKNYKKIHLIIEDVYSNDKKLGSIGSFINFIHEYNIEDDILILAADNYFEQNLNEFINAFNGNPLIGIYDIGNINRAKEYGVVEVKDDRLIDFSEKPNVPKSTNIGTGAYIIPNYCFKYIQDIPTMERDHLGILIEKLLENNIIINIFPFNQKWEDIGSIKKYYDLFIEKSKGKSIYINSNSKLSTSYNSLLYNSNIFRCEIENSIIFDSNIKKYKIKNKIIMNNKIYKL